MFLSLRKSTILMPTYNVIGEEIRSCRYQGQGWGKMGDGYRKWRNNIHPCERESMHTGGLALKVVNEDKDGDDRNERWG